MNYTDFQKATAISQRLESYREMYEKKPTVTSVNIRVKHTDRVWHGPIGWVVTAFMCHLEAEIKLMEEQLEELGVEL
jgi:hypothetical protein